MSRKIFVTGVTGYLGSAIAARAAREGHQVFGLTQDADRATALEARGIHAVVGELARHETYLGSLKNCDDVIHVALDGDDAAASDQAFLAAVRDASQDGRVRRLLYTSGCWVMGDTHGEIADESWPLDPLEVSRWRAAHEEVALDLADHDCSVVIFRPAIVYGESRGILGALFDEARDHQVVTWAGDGAQHWPLVHRDDVADAYALALERARGGERFILADGSEHTAREVAEALAPATGASARGADAVELVRSLGNYGVALLADQRLSADRARRELGWTPRHVSFVAEAADLHREWQASQDTSVA